MTNTAKRNEELVLGGRRYPMTKDPTDATVGRNLTLLDNNNIVRGNAAGNLNFTIPNDATVEWGSQAIVTLYQVGAGTLTLVAGAGVTLRADSAATPGQNKLISAIRVGSNEWVI